MALRHFLRLLSIGIILIVSSVAWLILSGVIRSRTYHADSRIEGAVQSLWGGPQSQRQPEACLHWVERTEEKGPERRNAPAGREDGATGPGETIVKERRLKKALPLASSRIEVDLDLEYRRKGLLWYSTYRADVDASYRVRGEEGSPGEARFQFFLPAQGGVYDNFQLFVNGEEREVLATRGDGEAACITADAVLPDGEEAVFRVRYTTQGLDTWRYTFGGSSQIRDFHLAVRTDFAGLDFPASAMSPTRKEPTDEGWELVWEYVNLVGGRDIAVAMPARLNPGPMAARISQFAPVSLLFFLGVLYFLYLLRGIPLHPVHYAFLAASFFSFHLLFAHLVDHLDLYLSFAIASAVSVFLVVTYLRVVVNPRFAFFQAGGLQLLYLVFFSFAHFFEGWTGLTVTVGAIVTLFVVMQMTARVEWEEVFPSASRGAPAVDA